MQTGVVYLVDDDASVREALSLLLGICGYTVRAFASAEALLLALTPEVRACVVTDVDLPGMSGLELAASLKRRNLRLPVVAMSGRPDESDARYRASTDIVAFLAKPFDGERLLAAVAAALTVRVEPSS